MKDYEAVYECSPTEHIDLMVPEDQRESVWFGQCDECGSEIFTHKKSMAAYRLKYPDGAKLCTGCSLEAAKQMMEDGQTVAPAPLSLEDIERDSVREISKSLGKKSKPEPGEPTCVFVCSLPKGEDMDRIEANEDLCWTGYCDDCEDAVFAHKEEHTKMHLSCLEQRLSCVDLCFPCACKRWQVMQEAGLETNIQMPDDPQQAEKAMKRMLAELGEDEGDMAPFFEHKPRF